MRHQLLQLICPDVTQVQYFRIRRPSVSDALLLPVLVSVERLLQLNLE